jgi:hypothetical protein
VPVLLAGADQPVTFGISIAIVAFAVGIFVLSMWRIHRQMVKARDGFVVFTRRLYTDAYAPIWKNPNVEVMDAQSAALRVASRLTSEPTTC